MKGKITKDIIFRVGQGVVRIPRENVTDTNDNQPPAAAPKPADPSVKKLNPENKPPRS